MFILFSFFFLDLLQSAALAAPASPSAPVPSRVQSTSSTYSKPNPKRLRPTKPSRSLSSLPPRTYLTLRPSKKVDKIKIVPRRLTSLEGPTPGETSFQVSQTGKNLVLKFQTLNPHLYLSLKDSLLIQLFAHPPLQISPTVITKSDWQRNQKGVPIEVSWLNNRTPVKSGDLFGRAVYTYCDQKTNRCKKSSSPIQIKVTR